MLKKFFLNALSSFIGAWIAIVLAGVAIVIVVFGLLARLGTAQMGQMQVTKDSVLVINLQGEIEERAMPVDFHYTFLSGNIEKKQSLLELVSAIEAAAENKNIKAIYIKCNALVASPASLNAIRNALLQFKDSGKDIIAYGDMLAMGDYYISSVADEIYLNPGGNVGLKGLGGITPFFKGLFDKLGVEFQVVKVGTYKSAVEPYIMEQMSEPARAQLDTLYGNMWNIILDGITEQRKGSLTKARIDTLINEDFIFLKQAKFALDAGLVDGICYERSMDSIIAAKIEKKVEDLNFVGPALLYSQEDFISGVNSRNQIAVLYASGEIVDGGGDNAIDFQKFVPVITALAENENVKGMVLRVNSPGGSVFGSEQIGEALDYFQSKGKPLAVSMGDYAASGGYWISCGADRIFADPLTITGSIGIFGLIPNVDGLLKKIGVNAELVSTNPQASFPSLFKPLNERQMAGMQKMVEEGYDMFVSRVAEGRHLSQEKVRKIGEGRVWDAVTAMKIGLVDQLGSVQDAIDWVAEKLEMENYNVGRYPNYEANVWDFLPDLMNMQQKMKIKSMLDPEMSPVMVERVVRILNRKPVQALMPEMVVRL